MPLAKKQSLENEAWLEAVKGIEQKISKDEINVKSEKAIETIKNFTSGKKSAYAWSGGKDSIVLGHICQVAGISDSMIAVCNLEYPAFMSWVNQNKPAKCEIINTGQDIEWLKLHTNMLFPQDSTKAARWFSIVQHRAQRIYYKSHELDCIILGRRRADGNYVGGKDFVYKDRNGVIRYSPLADWKHEEILAYIHYNNLPLPPIYNWKNGYLCGTHPWPARQWTKSIENGWAEVYEIDKSIVEFAAQHIDSAKAFMEGMK